MRGDTLPISPEGPPPSSALSNAICTLTGLQQANGSRESGPFKRADGHQSNTDKTGPSSPGLCGGDAGTPVVVCSYIILLMMPRGLGDLQEKLWASCRYVHQHLLSPAHRCPGSVTHWVSPYSQSLLGLVPAAAWGFSWVGAAGPRIRELQDSFCLQVFCSRETPVLKHPRVCVSTIGKFCLLCYVACRILFPSSTRDQTHALQWKCGVLDH